MAKARRTITLGREADQVLERVGNHSDYISKIVLQHASDWKEALALLHQRGWQPDELLAACDALAGVPLSKASREGEFLGAEISRTEELHGNFKKRHVSAARRERCFQQLTADRELAHALATLVREYWLHNEDCQHAIRRGARG